MLNKLQNYLTSLESLLVCYSGGVDSALLLHVCGLTAVRAEAVFVDSILVPRQDAAWARDFVTHGKIKLHTIEHDIFSVAGLDTNPENRCYLCKRAMLQKAVSLAHERGLKHVAEGSHIDDLQSWRPGRQAIRELGVCSPFEAVGMGKADIRKLSHDLGLPSWDKPSFSCLLTRLPHDELVDPAVLGRVEQAEQMIRTLGLRDFRA
ncbi:MAG: ATP-dependent sacrificial sulfur transferase LarE, partial [Deferribacteraceae bacterium]|nr:ATP-dependent sacrificial sulfur transferase LarE [Deferribacteraceae bacterium]